jgi:hypothetical protein
MNTIKFKCPHCGQRISGGQELVGTSVDCPGCFTAFAVAAPLLIPFSPTQDGKSPPPKRNSLLVPLICISAFFALTIIAAVVYFFHHNWPVASTMSASHSPSTPVPFVPVQATPVPASPSPPKPTISEETKARLASFLEKAGKLRVMTDQGIRLDEFRAQLSEVRGAWESVSTLGLPKQLKSEEQELDTAVSSWALAQEIWSEQISVATKAAESPGKDVIFALHAPAQYGDRLDVLSARLHATGVSPTGLPNLSGKAAFEGEIVHKLFGMASLMVANLAEARGPRTIEFLAQQFKRTQDDVLLLVQEVFGKGDLPKRLNLILDGPDRISEIIRKIAEIEPSLRSGGLSQVEEAKKQVEIDQLTVKLALTKKAVAEITLAISGTPPSPEANIPNETRFASPDGMIKWCLRGCHALCLKDVR